MPSLSAYHLTGVSLTLDMGYLFTAAPAKCSHCSLPWMWGISSWLPLLTLDLGYLFSAARCSSTMQLLLLTLDIGYLLSAATPDLGRGVGDVHCVDIPTMSDLKLAM